MNRAKPHDWKWLISSPLVFSACILSAVCLTAPPILSGTGIFIPDELAFWCPTATPLLFVIGSVLALFRCLFAKNGAISRFGPISLQLLSVALVFCWNPKHDASKAVPYKILYDDMGSFIKIGVDSDVSEVQLRETLAKAADGHQDDSARDYLISYSHPFA